MARYMGSGAMGFILRGLMPSQSAQIARARAAQQAAQSRSSASEPPAAKTQEVMGPPQKSVQDIKFSGNRRKALDAERNRLRGRAFDLLDVWDRAGYSSDQLRELLAQRTGGKFGADTVEEFYRFKYPLSKPGTSFAGSR